MAHWARGLAWLLESWPRLGRTGPVLARGVLLGLGAAVPIGPVNVQIARRALRHGFLAGFALGCGAVTADITYAAVSSLSFARLLNRPPATQIIGAAGVLLLAYLAVSCFRAARQAWSIDPISIPSVDASEPDDREPSDASEGSDTSDSPASRRLPAEPPAARSGYVTGLLMTLLNPMTLAFWFTVVPATAAGASAAGAVGDGGSVWKQTQAVGGELPITCAGVFIGTLAWVVTFAGLLARAGSAGRSRRHLWLAAADAVGGLTLLAFAALALWRLVRPYL